MTTARLERDWLARLETSRTDLIEAARGGAVDSTALRKLADHEAAYALDLHPLPRDPAAHLAAAHAWTRPYLERLPVHDPSTEVFIVDHDGDEGRSYTPRKPLRRVLDHALDHLNQIDQWLAWQEDGIEPIPTDGWVGSFVTLPEDHAPLTAPELAAWLWRIDLTLQMTIERAARLSPAQLDWSPPDGGWPLRRTLYHLGRAERLYSVWLDEALPEAEVDRYAEGSRRLHERLVVALAEPLSNDMVYVDDSGLRLTPVQIIDEVLDRERALLSS